MENPFKSDDNIDNKVWKQRVRGKRDLQHSKYEGHNKPVRLEQASSVPTP